MAGSIISHTFGLFMSRPTYPSVYFTADSQHCSPRQIELFYREADIVFQDCECIGCDMKTGNLDYSSGVHANYAQLAAWDSANSIDIGMKIRNKMYLSHYQDFVLDNKDYKGQDCDWNMIVKNDGFKGFTKVGDVVEI
jgi:hypothetical protein